MLAMNEVQGIEITKVAGRYRVMDSVGKRWEFKETKAAAQELKRKWQRDYCQAVDGDDLPEGVTKSGLIRQMAIQGLGIKEIQTKLIEMGHYTRYQMVFNVVSKLRKTGNHLGIQLPHGNEAHLVVED